MSYVFIEPVKSDNQRNISKKLSMILKQLTEISALAFDDPETAWFYQISESFYGQLRWKAIDFDMNELFVMAAFRKWAESTEEMSR